MVTKRNPATKNRATGRKKRTIKDLNAAGKSGSVKGGNPAEVRTAQSAPFVSITTLDSAGQQKSSRGPGPGPGAH